MYRLFHEFAHRYDLHTPPGHYQHDHAFVIREALRIAPQNCRLLDVGCGTGVFLEAALAAGIDVHGIDAAPEMIDVARRRIANDRVRVQRMQDIADSNTYDVVCALSWTIHYSETATELAEVIRRFSGALRAGGLLVLQVANDEQMNSSVNVDYELGPSGKPDDTLMIHQCRPLRDPDHTVAVHYVYVSRAHREVLAEQHTLRFGHPSMIADALRRFGFQGITVVNSTSISPFVISTTV